MDIHSTYRARVDKGQMFTGGKCSQGANVHTGQIFTQGKCSYRTNDHTWYMFTQGNSPHRANVHTGQQFTQGNGSYRQRSMQGNIPSVIFPMEMAWISLTSAINMINTFETPISTVR